ncbi:MAG: AAA family ATPase [Actinomycetota bacterium]
MSLARACPGANVKKTNPSSTLIQGSAVLKAGRADVARIRERTRRRRIIRAFLILGAIDAYLWYRQLSHNPIRLPTVPDQWLVFLPLFVLFMLIAVVMLWPIASGRSPHMLVRPEEIEVGLTDVKGLDGQVDEVMRTLDVFLGYATFRDELGGNPRRGILFEGPPGTGKTYLAKAMARQAGVPFMFVSAPAFQSVWFGMTAVRIRSFFRALRKAARREGGAIGFIEEVDAVGGARGGLTASPDTGGRARVIQPFSGPSGSGGMVNELLIQMQSFDQPPFRQRMKNRFIEWMNSYLQEDKRIKTGTPKYSNILLIAATNRADSLDPALLRPGRFDRRLYFDLPTKQERHDLIDFFLERKAHHEELDDPGARDRLAHDTLGYTPVMIEHLFDEALLMALRQGRRQMNVNDVYDAKLTDEIGLRQPVVYTDAERKAIATHEAGHATVAYLVDKGRRLEVLSIIKRRQALGLLQHGDLEERFTRSRTELEGMIAIALGGLVSEELFLGESGTGPAADLSGATEVAAQMVGALGMSGSLISYDAMLEGPMNSKNLSGKVLSDADGKRRVEEILEAQRGRVMLLLRDNQDIVDALRDALMERDELVRGEILQVIEQALTGRPA